MENFHSKKYSEKGRLNKNKVVSKYIVEYIGGDTYGRTNPT